MLLFLTAVSLALIISFVCSIAEATLLSVGHARVEALARTGHRVGAILRRFKQQPDEPIAAILVLNTIANTAGGVVAGHEFERAFPGIHAAWFAGVFTISVLLFTEITPKTLGVLHANRLAVPVAWTVHGMAVLLRPVLVITRVLARALGSRNHSTTTSLEEIRLLATAGQAQGVFGALTGSIIANATRLRETRVRDVMVPRSRMTFLSGTWSIEKILEVVRRTGHSRFPFTPNGELDQVQGVLLAKELLFALRDDAATDLQDLLIPLLVVPETNTLNHVLRGFQREKRHLAIVVDEYGGVQGMVTLEDVLEEIVGEIEDELDAEETHMLARRDGSLLCRGIAETRRLFARLQIHDVATDSQSLSGFLAERLGSVPWAGAEVEIAGYRFTVTKANNKRAERVRIDRLPADDGKTTLAT